MSRVPREGRREFKFVIPLERREELLDLLVTRLVPDPHGRALPDDSLGYCVHTLYLDTPDWTDYFDRLRERRIRNRLRIRTYGHPGDGAPVFLENKRKKGPWVVKHRARVCDADTWQGLREERPWRGLAAKASSRERFAAKCFCSLVDGQGRLPVSVVHYEREAFVSPQPGSDVRLTLDKDVRAAAWPGATDLFHDVDSVPLIPRDWMVLELKFGRTAPGWMAWLTQILRISVVPVSKYGLSIVHGPRKGQNHEIRYLTPHPLLEHAWTA